jgi:hypothetical protein
MRISVRPLPSRMTKVGSVDCFTPACLPTYTPPMLPSPTLRRRSAHQLPLRLLTDPTQRDRSRSRRRSRSPRRSRRSYDSRSRSRSRDNYRRDERRSRSPVNGSAAAPNYPANNAYPSSDREGGAAAAAPRNFEERVVAKEQMMQNVREHSQQDRRVYVGNLSYDVKWHHLKDFMRQGENERVQHLYKHDSDHSQLVRSSSLMSCFSPMECRRWAHDFLAGFPGYGFYF